MTTETVGKTLELILISPWPRDKERAAARRQVVGSKVEAGRVVSLIGSCRD